MSSYALFSVLWNTDFLIYISEISEGSETTFNNACLFINDLLGTFI